MPKELLLETTNKNEPVFLLCGNNTSVINFLLQEYEKDFKIAHITNSSSNKTKDTYYRILPESSYLIDKLEDTIEYAVIFLDEEKDKIVLQSILPKLERDKTKTLILIPLAKRNEFYDIVLELKKNKFIKFGFLADIFGQKISLSNSNISKIIQNAILKGAVSLPEDTASSELCISDNDFFTGINHILFSQENHKQFFYLLYEHPQTYTSIIHLLSRVEPGLAVSFTPNEIGQSEKNFSQIENEIESKTLTKPTFLDKYYLGFEKSVRRIASSKNPVALYSENEITTDVPKHKKIRKIKMPWKQSLLIALLLFIFIHVVSAGLGYYSFTKAKSSFSKKDFISAQKFSQESLFFISPIYPTTKLIAGISSFLSGGNSSNGVGFLNHSFDLFTTATTTISSISSAKNGITEQLLTDILSTATYLFFELQNTYANNATSIPNLLIQKEYTKLLTASGTLHQILGFDREKKYLLLFQNNGELRPTGGFIGSIGEVTIAKGKITDFHINNVYDVDGQLKAHVEPHYIVRRYLQPHLYLRDSNFAINFENSASTSALIYDLALQKKVDGVIGITFEAVRQIIKELGPITLSSYNVTLDENNTFDFLQNEIEANNFPGSNKKQEILQTLFNTISLKVEQDKNSLYKIFNLFPQLVSSKNILFAFNTTSIQKVFSVNGFSGSLFDSRDKKDENLYDTLSVNEANIGVNKANASINRHVEYDIFLTKNSITTKATLTLTSTKNSAPSYKTYIRFVAPAGSNLKTITIDGVKQTLTSAITDYKIYEGARFAAPKGLEVDTARVDDLVSFGFITTVLPGTKQKIEAEYDNGAASNTSGLFTYSLFFVKQPGTMPYPLTVRLHYSNEFAPQKVENATLNKNTITIQELVDSDKEIQMNFIKR